MPTRITATPTGGGDYNERVVVSCKRLPNRSSVMDRGSAKCKLFNKVVDIGSGYVSRIYDSSVHFVTEQRPLSDADKADRLLSEEVISLKSDSGKCVDATGQDYSGFIRTVLLSKMRSSLHVPSTRKRCSLNKLAG